MSRTGYLRVVSGTARGRRFRAPGGEETRPTSDRVREAVFNALYSLGAIEGAEVADLFAGSGALGIEALSRGARHAHFVESAPEARAVIEENLETLGLRSRATIVGGDVAGAMPALPRDLDLILADPPYAFDGWPDLMDALARVAAPGAVAVLESDREIEVGAWWEKMRQRTYGGTVITFVAIADAPRASQPSETSARAGVEQPPARPTGADA